MAKPEQPAPGLEQISTHWSSLNDLASFTLRYAPAIRAYLAILLGDEHEADEAAQEFMLRVLERGFARANPELGRFRDYLKTAVRNAALSRLRRKRPGSLDEELVEELGSDDGNEARWLGDWQRCLLERAWRALEAHQRQSPGNLFFTVLRVSADHPDEDSTALAERTSALAGRDVRADAFRKQVSRARRMFAEVLLQEVAATLSDPTPARVEEELIEVGLWPYVRDFLPEQWRPTPPGTP
jgi:RNA polymerase sigma factor (sigma-70 family)